ncbi:hypothetical protein [Flavobacterium covae]|uniref:hypothetical protein n=1 Tax=Flavobacterium covae TaxID=2906076 RepID=UPI0035E43E2D
MDRLIKYNMIAQNYIGDYLSIPFINTKYKENNKYNVFVNIINSDYLKTFFQTFEINNLYAIFNADEIYIDNNKSILFKFQFNEQEYYIIKIENYFFLNIVYTDRYKIYSPIFFRSNLIEEINFENLLSVCFYETLIFQKKVFRIDRLKLLSEENITGIVLFTETEIAYTESILNLKNLTLDDNEDYMSVLEVFRG